MTNEIEIINPTEYGIEENKANELMGNLPQIINERSELEKQFNEVIKMDIESPETTLAAHELRILIQKNRTQGINIWHRTTKDFFLKGGQFVDAIKRKEVAVNERMESDLTEIEKHAEIKEKKRLYDLQNKRWNDLEKYVEYDPSRDLSMMEDDVWTAYLETKKKEYNDRIEAEKKAELERIAKEKAEQEDRERIKKENEKLRKEAEDRERLAKIEAEKRAKEDQERKVKEEADRKAREEKERKERESYEAKLKSEREARERVEREEKAKREKLEAEIKANEEADKRLKEEHEAKIQAELSKGDVEKVKDLINDLIEIKTKFRFKSKKNQKMYSDVCLLVDKVISHIEK